MYRSVLATLMMTIPLAFAPAAFASDDAMQIVAKEIETNLGVYIYPKEDQDAAKQASDTIECYDSAKQRSGIDPQAPPPEPEQAEKQGGGAAKGAARGAARGAAIGAVAGDAGKGAAVGATGGAMRGRSQQKQAAASAQQQAEQEAAAAATAQMDEFNKAFGACMDARDYSVK